jgi:hypothetical protein
MFNKHVVHAYVSLFYLYIFVRIVNVLKNLNHLIELIDGRCRVIDTGKDFNHILIAGVQTSH